jgi:hypothetical protein
MNMNKAAKKTAKSRGNKPITRRELMGGWSAAPENVARYVARPWYPFNTTVAGTQGPTSTKIVYTAANIASVILTNAGLAAPTAGISFRIFEANFYCIADQASTDFPNIVATTYGIPAGQSMATHGDVGSAAVPASVKYTWPKSMQLFPMTSTGTNDVFSFISSADLDWIVVFNGVWCVPA